MIVGHKIEQYLTAERTILSPTQAQSYWTITTHRVITELHATKGWRPVGHTRHIQHVRRLPSIRDWRNADITTFERTRKAGAVRQGGAGWIDNVSPAIRDRAVNRHKVRRVETQRALNAAENVRRQHG